MAECGVKCFCVIGRQLQKVVRYFLWFFFKFILSWKRNGRLYLSRKVNIYLLFVKYSQDVEKIITNFVFEAQNKNILRV